MFKATLLAFVVTAAACGHKKPPPPPPPAPVAEKPAPAPTPPPAPPPPPAPKHATATMVGTAKYKKVKGTVEFKEVDGGIEVTANIEGLSKGNHGFHIHEKGDCSAPDAMSAGGHFNPTNMKHGAPDAEEHHEGDLGNITADKSGKGTVTVTLKGATLGEGDTSIAGKGFINHAKADDMKTQPTGNAGDRVACGTITVDDAAGAAPAAKE